MGKMQVLKRGKSYNILGEVIILHELENKNYVYTEGMYGPQLDEIDDIILPEKIYSADDSFTKHVIKSWENKDGNVGVCLVGGKGLGKSLAANIIAKNANAPIIHVKSTVFNDNLFRFLDEIKQDFVLMIDEFEKLFKMTDQYDDPERKENGAISQESFLSFLDGGSLKERSVLFVITSNSEYKISEFLKNRPSRIKYYRSYDSMKKSTIMEIVDDLLEDKSFREDLLQNVPYEGLNTDSLIQIIKEINTHQIPYSEFKDFFNFREKENCRFDSKVDVGGKIFDLGSIEGRVYSSHSYLGSLNGKPVYTKKQISLNSRISLLENVDCYISSNGDEKNIDVLVSFKKEEAPKLNHAYSI